ncbi:hypothetical protein GCM10010464_19640 [Pseudonocardia yunnanensis]|uniref:Uncharacterized protein n=1 Tax=Pseudonocardia yunnanensis TaxID=58107 RepID=A0ABW4ESV7_9PSEU
MPRSVEHEFVTESFLAIVEELSESRIYGYPEADRGKLDFACALTANRERLVAGQTLTHHAAGIEKDLNILLLENLDSIPVYLYEHSTRNEARIQEVIHRFRRSEPDRVSLLRTYRYPSEFDADNEVQREVVRDSLRNQIIDDLLLNVIFGRLAGTDVDYFLSDSRSANFGLTLTLLEYIAVNGYDSQRRTVAALKQQDVSISGNTLSRQVQTLLSSGMLEFALGRMLFRVSQRGKIFLRICSLIDPLLRVPPSFELRVILNRLGLDTGALKASDEFFRRMMDEKPRDGDPLARSFYLVAQIVGARHRYGLELSGGPYLDDPGEIHGGYTGLHWTGR